MSKGNKIRLIIVIALVLFFAYGYYFAFLFPKETCATVVGIGSIGALGKDNAYELKYNVDNRELTVSMGMSFFKKSISFDSLKRMECIRIEYSELTNSFCRVIDDRVVAE